ncbi:peptidylprolyl isomerase [Novosphingobium sp. PASSN1]|uniref:peptidylprolyl isomerase n=1 Tax=Novosphingobium sp. PASSN1 TaxID=2015561 RepID=UPI000BCD9658|nr:peptidylprolyl isomerase [Novosphingobium sp. PASSN1]OYU33847.1 MAG: peptidylprolyl isomerase [Novosphingobium sp. PASSN1]
MIPRRFVLAALPLAAMLVAAAPQRRSAPAAPPAPPPPLAAVERIALVTEMGTIELALDGAHAPISTANFLRYVDAKRFDGITFYRAMHLAWGDQPNGLLQGGLRDPRRLFPPIAHEPTSQTGLSHTAGAISMARNAPGTATADFSIMLSDIIGLDADPKSADPEAQAGYAVFGKVTAGMDVVRKIWDSPISQTLGEGVMRGQMLEAPVKILTARRLPPAP